MKPYTNKLTRGSNQWWCWLEDKFAAKKGDAPIPEPGGISIGDLCKHKHNKTKASVLMRSPDKVMLQFEGSFNTKTYTDEEFHRWYLVL